MIVSNIAAAMNSRGASTWLQGRQPEFRSWVPKIGNCEIFWCPIFQGITQYIEITTMIMYLLIEIRQNHIQVEKLQFYS